jgi:hypothetical protein
LEGWSLTLKANYIDLVDSETAERTICATRGIDYIRGAMQFAASRQPGRAAVFQKRVLAALQDQSVNYG